MKKAILLLLTVLFTVLMLMTASAETDVSDLKIAAPSGAPALALATLGKP